MSKVHPILAIYLFIITLYKESQHAVRVSNFLADRGVCTSSVTWQAVLFVVEREKEREMGRWKGDLERETD